LVPLQLVMHTFSKELYTLLEYNIPTSDWHIVCYKHRYSMEYKYAMDTLNIFFSCIVYDVIKLQRTLTILYMTLQDLNEYVSVSLSSGVYFLFRILCVCYRMDIFVRDTDNHNILYWRTYNFSKIIYDYQCPNPLS
jgi:hypothetical protein